MIFLKVIIGILATVGLALLTMWFEEKRNDMLGNHKLKRFMFILEFLSGALALFIGVVTFILFLIAAIAATAMVVPQVFGEDLYNALMSL